MPPVTRSLRLLLCTALAAGALLLVACGEGDPGPYGNVEGETEATYLELGGLKYQIQTSRQLNPNDAQDRALLEGVPPQSALRRGEVFFGVFLRVENDEEEETHPTSGEFHIEDTQEQVFRPIPLGPENSFRYVPQPLEPGGLIPVPDSAAWHTPVQGALLPFRIEQTALENRPLEFIIESPVGTNTASVSLDI